MATAAEFVGLMFFERSVAHAQHLVTSSFSQHKALDDFYNEIVEVADSFAEAYQGKYGPLDGIQLSWATPDAEISDFLRDGMNWIETNRYMIVPTSDTFLQNLIDEVVALHATTLDKLRRY
jgi:hypothetical protein